LYIVKLNNFNPCENTHNDNHQHGVTSYASDGEPMVRVREMARTSLSVVTRIVAPVQGSLPDR